MSLQFIMESNKKKTSKMLQKPDDFLFPEPLEHHHSRLPNKSVQLAMPEEEILLRTVLLLNELLIN